MNTVTFETAKALRDAGFPQPEFAIRQTWYAYLYPEIWPYGTEFYIANTNAMRFITISEDRLATTGVQDSSRQGEIYGGSVVFAPQAHDILAELESDFDISCLQDKTWMVICRNAADQLTPIAYFTDPNPHEAAAKAYLQLHKPA